MMYVCYVKLSTWLQSVCAYERERDMHPLLFIHNKSVFPPFVGAHIMLLKLELLLLLLLF